jgi:hypothetical protein
LRRPTPYQKPIPIDARSEAISDCPYQKEIASLPFGRLAMKIKTSVIACMIKYLRQKNKEKEE